MMAWQQQKKQQDKWFDNHFVLQQMHFASIWNLTIHPQLVIVVALCSVGWKKNVLLSGYQRPLATHASCSPGQQSLHTSQPPQTQLRFVACWKVFVRTATRTRTTWENMGEHTWRKPRFAARPVLQWHVKVKFTDSATPELTDGQLLRGCASARCRCYKCCAPTGLVPAPKDSWDSDARKHQITQIHTNYERFILYICICIYIYILD